MSVSSELIKELKKIEDYERILMKLRFHHLSQAKPHTVKCSPDHHRTLVGEIDKAIGLK